MWQTSKNREENRASAHSHPVLAQAEMPCSGELLLPRRELEKREQWLSAISRLGETSSPERDGLSLKIGARSLSDSLSRKLGQVAADLA
ncbi:hypothetical protein DEO72_LG6g1310 [Vigna unguiculata]|uniref:Uncharacterized protein n=1 Tax=Vigna unguiculata TaxID=3917 RepID=A0A4D6M9U9_VIGUN|nr:hypothetical protein DEO72_LG6g1310 [Vigna unguiculata]